MFPPPDVAPPPEPSDYPRLRPFASIVGGAKGDTVIQADASHRDGRISAIMLSDFGLRGELASWASFESELMANGGPSLHGSSAFEGQAALQVRKQVLHLAKDWWMVEVGRVIDEASVDAFSAHVADVFLQDTATRDPLLFSGFNLGNGVRGTAEVLPGLRVGLAANAGNPTSTSSILEFGGAFPPFDRIFYQAAQKTREDISGYPDDHFHAYVVTPSILYKNEIVDARAALQGFVIDPNTGDGKADDLRGYNLRGAVQLHLWGDTISPFVNASLGRNDTVDPSNVTKLASAKYTGVGAGGGVDFNYQKRFGRSNGVGVQLVQDQFKVGDGVRTTNRYYNVGTTYWLSKNIAAGARFALWKFEQRGQDDAGERSLLVTLRVVL